VESPKDIWATATGEAEGLPVVYRYRQNRPHGANWIAYPHALRIRWTYDLGARNGMPPSDINEKQVGLEDAIETLGEGPLGYLMLVFTGAGRKDWLYYVVDPGDWVHRLNELLKRHESYPLDIENWPDERWSVWQDFANSVTDS
jgi:hypothetical protein